MQTDRPQITVLMPAYNAGTYIREAITSVLQQSFKNFELLVVNDGSTDDTLSIALSFYDPRIIVINKDHAGIASALNTGLKLASAPYVARFEADDICLPNRLETQLDFLHDHPEYVLVGS